MGSLLEEVRKVKPECDSVADIFIKYATSKDRNQILKSIQDFGDQLDKMMSFTQTIPSLKFVQNNDLKSEFKNMSFYENFQIIQIVSRITDINKHSDERRVMEPPLMMFYVLKI